VFNQLLIAGKPVQITSQFALRWYDTPEGNTVPILYKNGKRVTKAWQISYNAKSDEDIEGANANTD